ncbi:MAG: MAPEG family protein [Caulobacterales bacterium]|jgi:uncharacterized MAPEG superfamily protein
MANEYVMVCVALAALWIAIWAHAVSGIAQNGPIRMGGNRDALPADNAFRARARRCVDNHIENLVLFAPLVLIAGQLGKFDAITSLAAMLFAGGRVAHAVLYLAGIPWLRTAAFAVSTTGIAMMALALFDVI